MSYFYLSDSGYFTHMITLTDTIREESVIILLYLNMSCSSEQNNKMHAKLLHPQVGINKHLSCLQGLIQIITCALPLIQG